MSAGTRSTRRPVALLVVLLVALTALPATAGARPYYDGPGYQLRLGATPTVTRTIVREESAGFLPVALAGTALVVALVGAGYTMVRTAPLRTH